MSSLVIIPSHGGFSLGEAHIFNQQTEFIPEMLGWPIQDGAGGEISGQLLNMYRTVLKVLMDLKPFKVIISLRVNNKALILTQREWAQIYFEDHLLVSFCYTLNEKPISHIWEWTGTLLSHSINWSEETWRQFFRDRISAVAKAVEERADDAIAKAHENKELAQRILSLIPHPTIRRVV